jgi:hypothetical protein
LTINTSETLILDLTKSNEDIQIQHATLQKVNNFTYLGSKLTLDGDTAKEIIRHIALASSAFNKLRNIWTSKTQSRTTKLSLFNSHIKPILSYGCKSWKATKEFENKLNACKNKCLRTILNIK